MVLPRTPLGNDDRARRDAIHEASRARQRAAEGDRQYLAEHIRFIPHHGKQILLLDVSNCSSIEVEMIFRATPEVVSGCPRGSVLILSDFSGASIDEEAIRVMKETAVFDKPYVKKSAWTGAQSFPRVFFKELSSFSRREFRMFEKRFEALEWLAKE
jgi:hypothetical protein